MRSSRSALLQPHPEKVNTHMLLPSPSNSWFYSNKLKNFNAKLWREGLVNAAAEDGNAKGKRGDNQDLVCVQKYFLISRY